MFRNLRDLATGELRREFKERIDKLLSSNEATQKELRELRNVLKEYLEELRKHPDKSAVDLSTLDKTVSNMLEITNSLEGILQKIISELNKL